MTERWLRWYDGTVRDGKLRIAADLCGLPVCTVVGVWASTLEDAATSEPRGTTTRTPEYHAMFLQISEHEIDEVWNALERSGTVGTVRNDKGTIVTVVVTNWGKRQYETDAKDPTSKVRKDKWKQSHKPKERNGTVRNAKERIGTPETETETESYIDRGRKKPEVRIPDDWIAKAESWEKAKALGFSTEEISREAQKFKNHARQKDRMAVRWDAAFDNWMINAATYQNKAPKEAEGKSNRFKALPGSPEFLAWKSYFRDQNKPVMTRELNQRELECRAFSFESQWPPGAKVA